MHPTLIAALELQSVLIQELGPLLALKEDDSAMAKLKQLMRERGILSE